MALVTLSEILKESRTKKYAVGAFDTFNNIFTDAILKAAEQQNSPVIMMVCDFSYSQPGADRFFAETIDRCRESKVPVAVHLDHGPSFEAVMKAIHYGCTSVMIDGSSLPMEENIAVTKKVVDAAHACGVSVEAEIGHVAGHEAAAAEAHTADAKAYTNLQDAIDFYEATKVDALAVAIGTVHGVYKGIPVLDFERLKQIRDAIPVPLVMHGGSGLSDENFRTAVENGISKINFYTGMSLAGSAAAKKFLEDTQNPDFGDVIDTASAEMTKVVAHAIETFGSALKR